MPPLRGRIVGRGAARATTAARVRNESNTGYFTCDITTGVCGSFNAWSGISLGNFNYATTFDGSQFFTVDSTQGGQMWVCPTGGSPACTSITMTVGGNVWPEIGITNLATIPR